MRPIRIEPDLRPRVWGGARLTPPGGPTIGEAWLAGPWSAIGGATAPESTLEDLAAELGARLTGVDAPVSVRFPLLAKIIDPAEWLSVQVHPDDEQALELEGAGAVGKTEAWYVIEAAPGAEILLGVQPSVPPEAVREAIRRGGLADLLQRHPVAAGEAYLVPAGTLHAIGPGVLVYEIQQPSDITYRCDDWGRPPSAGRPLHIEQSLVCVRPGPWTESVRSSAGTAARGLLVECDHFVLEYLRPAPQAPVPCDPGLASLHLLTAVSGSVVVSSHGWQELLEPYATLVVPADAGPYTVAAPEAAPASVTASLVLLARLPAADERGSASR
jgi:mannose-6-phosphate isomerase